MSELLVVESLEQLRAALKGADHIGFVPTMGALHPGHATLIERAAAECERVVVSIFVNPTQFAPGEDFEAYPRSRDSDVALCEQAGAHLAWFPRVDELYPLGAQTWVEVERLGSSFEGVSRPTHFRGVATVVTKLFHAVQPDKAYFGQKDLQQLHLIRQMVKDLLFDIEVVGVPTSRESTGLARSSRNSYLSELQREQAASIYRALLAVQEKVRGGGATPKMLQEIFEGELAGFEGACLERFDLFKPELSGAYGSTEEVQDGHCSVAVRIGKVRLIDNIQLCFSP